MTEKSSEMENTFDASLERLGVKKQLSPPITVREFCGDGSQRRFFRLTDPQHRSLILIIPPKSDPAGLREAHAAYHIGLHLAQSGASVGAIHGFSEKDGLLLCEDLGKERLFERVESSRAQNKPFPLEIYRETVRSLALMQVRGAENFDPAWCWDTPLYNRSLMLERESGYFLNALCIDYLGLRPQTEQLGEEFEKIAGRASSAPATFFLHRDFQSRNIMLHQERPYFIDYQGGRMGPLAYDLASLLIDPYTEIPPQLQEELLEEYFSQLRTLISYDEKSFRAQYYVLALQRNLQILGAFAFLSQVRGKDFFTPYIRPALCNLQSMLAKVNGEDYPALRNMTQQCLHKVSNEF